MFHFIIKATIHLLLVLFVISSSAFAYNYYDDYDDSTVNKMRIKDITDIQGIRNNPLIGYGIVVGLKGTGDDLKNSIFTEKGLVEVLQKFGISTKGTKLKTKNVASVLVSAQLPAFARKGTNLDISVSALGDASSLEGGILITTPLLGSDGNVYALAQGTISTSSFQAAGKTGSSVRKGIPTTGFVPNGAVVEKEINFKLADMESMAITLKNPDITTATNIAIAINEHLQKGEIARATDPSTVRLAIKRNTDNIMHTLHSIEQIEVKTDNTARIVMDESSGTIVMGSNVKVSSVAIAQGNLQISISEAPYVSQPNAFSKTGESKEVSRTIIDVQNSGDSRMSVLNENATLQELVSGLNALGVSPQDLIAILRVIKKSGALHAEIISM